MRNCGYKEKSCERKTGKKYYPSPIQNALVIREVKSTYKCVFLRGMGNFVQIDAGVFFLLESIVVFFITHLSISIALSLGQSCS